jgi:hypothetical protein
MNDIPTQGSSPVSGFPIQGSTTKPFFPAVCLTYHWDPTMILSRTLPQGPDVPLPLDPRPWAKVCLQYVNSGQSSEQAPPPPKNMVFPMGGEFYPPTRYSSAIDQESLLRRLDRTIDTCDVNNFYPNPKGHMYVPNMTVPDRKEPNSRFVQELAMPRVLLRDGPYDCFQEALEKDWARSPFLFNNATKQQRYNQTFPGRKI